MATQVEVLARRRGRAAARRWIKTHPWRRYREQVLVVAFYAAVVLTGAAVVQWPLDVPTVALAPWIVLAALFLSVRALRVLYVIVSIYLLGAAFLLWDASPFGVIVVVGLAALMVMMFVLAISRARLGISGFTGENMLVDLRDRLARAAQLPPLPAGWTADHAVQSAFGEVFSGDFLVGALTEGGRHLQVVLVDVSGKGRQAGSRSLHLSGALSGLLGSVPVDEFLPAANAFLIRQRWDEGFASAVHLDLDLTSGDYSIGRAGHPPPARFHGGQGHWRMVRGVHGPILGVLPSATFVRARGTLAVGDALLFYSDGVVESPSGDLIDGVDRMLGVASRALIASDSGRGFALTICGAAPAGTSDDRAVFILRRD